MTLPDFDFYSTVYGGTQNKSEFTRYLRTAEYKLDYFDRVYTLIGDDQAEKLALCALADILKGYADVQDTGNPSSASIGSVSVAMTPKDTSAKAINRDCLSAIQQFLDVYRGKY